MSTKTPDPEGEAQPTNVRDMTPNQYAAAKKQIIYDDIVRQGKATNEAAVQRAIDRFAKKDATP